MKDRILNGIINYYKSFVKGIDFAQMPERESEEYRTLVLKTASNQIFCEGRYGSRTEMTLEIFEREDVQQALGDLKRINKLDEADRARLRFYLDLKETCYPLFRGQKVDWTAWPWNMQSDRDSIENSELVQLILNDDYLCLGAAICFDLKQQVWCDQGFYSSVARQEMADNFFYGVNNRWKRGDKELKEALDKYTDDLWFAENHMLVGRQLGFDLLTQSVYDAMDTYIDRTYRHNQVDFAREMAAWLREHWTVGEPHPSDERVEELYQVWDGLMKKHQVQSPDLRYSWNILTLDVLGMSMFSEEQERKWREEDGILDDDDKLWEPEQDDLD